MRQTRGSPRQFPESCAIASSCRNSRARPPLEQGNIERSFPMVGARLDPDDRTASLSRAEQLDLKEVQADVREAYRELERRHTRGKIVLRP